VVIPPWPAAFSALGILGSDRRRDFTRTWLSGVEAAGEDSLEAEFALLEAEAASVLAADGEVVADVGLLRGADLRYAGQQFTITVGAARPVRVAELIEVFTREHRRLYGHAMEGRPVEVTNLRLTVVQGAGVPPVVASDVPQAQGSACPKGERRILHRDDPRDVPRGLTVPVYQREGLPLGARLRGPAIVEEASSTVLLLPGDELEVAHAGTLVVAVGS
jgi:N-methylhydantoinase A